MKPQLLALLVCSVAAAQTTIQQYNAHDFAFQASAPGNPFDVELTGEFTGPEGARLRVPGFYDGEGRWVIRFAPTRTGQWSMKTVSSLPALDGKTENSISCVPNRHPNIHGRLRVDPAYPHHFIYEDGTRYFLMGYEADWLWGAGMRDPDRRLMRRLIDQMADRGFNHVLVNVYAHDTRWSAGRKHEWDWGPPEMYAWEGTNEKPDHSRLNPAFFKVYDGMMLALQDKGIVAHIMLKVYNKAVNWPAKWSRDEERYFRYVVARYQAFPNVVWDFAKESYNEKDEALQSRLIDLVRTHDVYDRLTTVHDDDMYEWDPELSRNVDFRTDQQHSDYAEMIAFDRSRRRYPVVNSEFAYERGVDNLPSYGRVHEWNEQLHRAWLVYMAGGYGVYYYHNTAWDVFKPDPEPPGMARFQLLKETLSALPYWRMQPSNHLAVGGPCLAVEGEVWAFYAEGDQLVADLSTLAQPQKAQAHWVNTWDGKKEPATFSQPGVHKLRKPQSFGKAPALLIVRAAR